MSTIQLAAHRSYTTGEAIHFTWRLPRFRRWFTGLFLWLISAAALLIAGQYAHIYWQCRHPVALAEQKKVAEPDVVLSDMHYVYVTKAFPHPATAVSESALPLATEPPTQQSMPVDELPVSSSENDWTHAPDGNLATRPLPDNHAEPSQSLEERLMQALKEQEQEYKPENDHPVPEQESTPPVSHRHGTEDYPQLGEQPASVQQRLPAMQYQSHVYSADPQNSKVVLDGKTYKPGDMIKSGVSIKALQPHNLIVEVDGEDYTLPALINWEPATR